MPAVIQYATASRNSALKAGFQVRGSCVVLQRIVATIWPFFVVQAILAECRNSRTGSTNNW